MTVITSARLLNWKTFLEGRILFAFSKKPRDSCKNHWENHWCLDRRNNYRVVYISRTTSNKEFSRLYFRRMKYNKDRVWCKCIRLERGDTEFSYIRCKKLISERIKRRREVATKLLSLPRSQRDPPPPPFSSESPQLDPRSLLKYRAHVASRNSRDNRSILPRKQSVVGG